MPRGVNWHGKDKGQGAHEGPLQSFRQELRRTVVKKVNISQEELVGSRILFHPWQIRSRKIRLQLFHYEVRTQAVYWVCWIQTVYYQILLFSFNFNNNFLNDNNVLNPMCMVLWLQRWGRRRPALRVLRLVWSGGDGYVSYHHRSAGETCPCYGPRAVGTERRAQV